MRHSNWEWCCVHFSNIQFVLSEFGRVYKKRHWYLISFDPSVAIRPVMDDCCLRLTKKIKHSLPCFTFYLTRLASCRNVLLFETTLANDLLRLISQISDHSLKWMLFTTSLHNLLIVAVMIKGLYLRSFINLQNLQLNYISWLEISFINYVSEGVTWWQDWLVRFKTCFILVRISKITLWFV